MTTHYFFPFAVLYASASVSFSMMSSVICDIHEFLEEWACMRRLRRSHCWITFGFLVVACFFQAFTAPRTPDTAQNGQALAGNQEASTATPSWELSRFAVLCFFGIIPKPRDSTWIRKYAKLFFAGFFVLSVIVICYFHGYRINIDDKIIIILIGCLGLGETAFNQYDLRCKMVPVAPRPVAV